MPFYSKVFEGIVLFQFHAKVRITMRIGHVFFKNGILLLFYAWHLSREIFSTDLTTSLKIQNMPQNWRLTVSQVWSSLMPKVQVILNDKFGQMNANLNNT